MRSIAIQRIVETAFTVEELSTLLGNRDFVARFRKLRTTLESQSLVVFGLVLLRRIEAGAEWMARQGENRPPRAGGG